MNFLEKIRSPKGSWVSFYGYYALFCINHALFRSRRLEQALWDHIKCDLFYIAGSCKSTGNCCRNLNIIRNGKPIDSISRFEALAEKTPVYRRFIPIMASPTDIQYFSCTSLNANNRCNHYDTRPAFCKAYPFGNFIKSDTLAKPCGYSVARTTLTPKIRNRRLQELINNVLTTNQIPPPTPEPKQPKRPKRGPGHKGV